MSPFLFKTQTKPAESSISPLLEMTAGARRGDPGWRESDSVCMSVNPQNVQKEEKKSPKTPSEKKSSDGKYQGDDGGCC